jgi:NOL1/NOP2/sun family putative RNA methylase
MKRIPDTENVELKKEFVGRYKKLLGKEYDRFVEHSFSFLRRSVRVNTLKASVKEIRESLGKSWKLTAVPWCDEGFWVESERRDIGNTEEHVLGQIYVQEAASMIPAIVLDPKPGEKVLDMCAAPGSKATQIAALMQNRGCLIANDYQGIRLRPLGLNMQRCGVTNAVITLMAGHQFENAGLEFDRVLVDAPCSGTGTIRTSLKTVVIWNPLMIKRLAGTQKRLIESGFKILKRGGTLVYSTCSLEPEENEGAVNFLINKYEDAEIKKVSLNVKSSLPITEFEKDKYSDEVKKCLRMWPQDNDTEGFFVAKIKKVA